MFIHRLNCRFTTLRSRMLLFCSLFIAGLVLGKQSREKRLLLNDPDVFDLRVSHIEKQLAELQTKYNDLLTKTTSDHGTTYVRWGRTRCNGLHAELVYAGYAAGQHYSDPSGRHGGPATTLCLPEDPQLANTTFTDQSSLIRGTEYETNYFAPDSQDEDVPCAVCRTTNASTSIMIPGRQTCYPGWRLEYGGFLASGATSHAASDYVCVDSSPEYIPSGKVGNDGHLFYLVGIKCGPLPCPPYEDNRKVYCVVCSK